MDHVFNKQTGARKRRFKVGPKVEIDIISPAQLVVSMLIGAVHWVDPVLSQPVLDGRHHRFGLTRARRRDHPKVDNGADAFGHGCMLGEVVTLWP